jgi:hypothetical protein
MTQIQYVTSVEQGSRLVELPIPALEVVEGEVFMSFHRA